jgi:hypothetical protein
MAIELGNGLNVERTFERLSGVVDQHPTRTPVVLYWLPLVATRLHTHGHDPNQPAARVVKIEVSVTYEFQAFHKKNLQTNGNGRFLRVVAGVCLLLTCRIMTD